MKQFSKPLQNMRNRQNEAVIGKGFWLMGLQVPASQKKQQQYLLMEEQTGPECRDAKGSAAFHKTNLAFEQGH